MRIIFDCERMKYVNTGLYHYCLNLGRTIQQHIRSEQLSVFIPNHVREAFDSSTTCIAQHSLQKFLMPSVGQYQIWHSTYQSSQYLPSRNKKIKVLLTIHDLNFLHEDKTPHKKAFCLKHVQQNIDRSDAIVCISEFTPGMMCWNIVIRGENLFMLFTMAQTDCINQYWKSDPTGQEFLSCSMWGLLPAKKISIRFCPCYNEIRHWS